MWLRHGNNQPEYLYQFQEESLQHRLLAGCPRQGVCAWVLGFSSLYTQRNAENFKYECLISANLQLITEYLALPTSSGIPRTAPGQSFAWPSASTLSPAHRCPPTPSPPSPAPPMHNTSTRSARSTRCQPP